MSVEGTITLAAGEEDVVHGPACGCDGRAPRERGVVGKSNGKVIPRIAAAARVAVLDENWFWAAERVAEGEEADGHGQNMTQNRNRQILHLQIRHLPPRRPHLPLPHLPRTHPSHSHLCLPTH